MVETSSKTHPQVGFLSLADELIINILTRLDLRTLVRCHRVCSVLHSIIQSAVDLQYKINLDMVGMQDVPANNGVGIVDRLKMLKDHSRAWKEGNPTETVLDGQMADERYYTCGGVLGYVNIDRDMRESLSLIQIPSRSRGIPERRWTLKDIGSIHEVALDPSQNLLVVVSDDEDADPQGGWSSQLQILDLKTGETHRLAQQRVLRYASHIISDELGSTTDVAICGRFLAISYSRFQTSVGDLDGDRVDTIVVLDWMTGDTHLCVYGENDRKIADHILLTDTHFMVLIRESAGHIFLKVFHLESHRAQPTVITNLVGVEFLLPSEVVESISPLSRPQLNTISPAVWDDRSTYAVPFFIGSDIRIVTLFYETPKRQGRMLIIPVSALLRHATDSNDPLIIPASSWIGAAQLVDTPWTSLSAKALDGLHITVARELPDEKSLKVDIYELSNSIFYESANPEPRLRPVKLSSIASHRELLLPGREVSSLRLCMVCQDTILFEYTPLLTEVEGEVVVRDEDDGEDDEDDEWDDEEDESRLIMLRF